ncbi:FAD-dependent oxidoreductase [bacterium]|nr:FAD-dependent oxidoreductase [bacterium]
MKVIIVGAGIYGLSAALRLAEQGHKVEVIDRGAIPHPQSSSFDYHRLIRHAYGDQQGYANLIPAAFGAWDRLWTNLGVSHYIQTGCLALGSVSSGWIQQSIHSLDQMDIACQVLDHGQVAESFPWLKMGTDEKALFTKAGGILSARKILESISIQLASLGVGLRSHTEIESIDFKRSIVWGTEKNNYQGDFILCALGAGHTRFFPGEIIPIRQVYSLIDDAPQFATIENGCPMILDISDVGGFYFVPGSSAFPLKIGDHLSRLQGNPYGPETINESDRNHIQTISDTRLSPDWAQPSRYGICYYSCTPDNTIQFESEVNYAKMYGGSGHGFKFGALFGELIADVITGQRKPADVSRIISGNSPV